MAITIMNYKTIIFILSLSIISPSCIDRSSLPLGATAANVETSNSVPTVPIATNQNQPSKYLWIEFWTTETGTTSDARCDDFYYIDGSNYMFQENTLTVSSQYAIELIKSSYILGCGKEVKHPVGSGIFNFLYPINGFPYTPDWADHCQLLTISNIDAFGTIHAMVNNKEIVLETGQTWNESVIDNSDSQCQRETSYELTNYGFLNSGQVIFPIK